jgi:hypothetical protein
MAWATSTRATPGPEEGRVLPYDRRPAWAQLVYRAYALTHAGVGGRNDPPPEENRVLLLGLAQGLASVLPIK